MVPLQISARSLEILHLVEHVISRIPLGQLGNVREIVGTVLFRASAAALMVTGIYYQLMAQTWLWIQAEVYIG